VSMPNRGQGLTPTENVGRGFILCPTLPAERAISQPHQMEMPVQGIMPGKKSGNHPGLFPARGQEFGPNAPIRPRDQLPSLSLVLLQSVTRNCLSLSLSSALVQRFFSVDTAD
jgi:hypothetical protein